MMPDDTDRWKQLAMQWKRAAPHLAAARRESIRRRNNAKSLESLNSLYREAIKRKKTVENIRLCRNVPRPHAIEGLTALVEQA